MRWKRSLFYKYLLTYMAVSVVTMLIIGGFIYRSNLQRARQALDLEHESTLYANRVFIDSQISALQDLALTLQARQATVDIQRIAAPIPPGLAAQLTTYSRELQPYTYSNWGVKELTLYFSGSGLFLSSTAVGQYPQVFYDVYLAYPGLDYPAWREEMAAPQSCSFRGGTDQRTGEQYLDIMQDLPYVRGGKVTVIARFHVGRLVQEMGGLSDSGAVLLVRALDGGGTVFTTDPLAAAQVPAGAANGEALLLDGQRCHLLSQTFQSVPWEYVLVIPDRLYLEGEQYVLRTLLLLCLAIFVSGGLLSLMFSFYHIAPVRALVRSMGGSAKNTGNKNEIAAIDASIKSLIQNNETLQTEVRKQQEYNRWSFADRLLKGQFVSGEERVAMSQYADIPLESPCYLLAVFQLAGYHQEIHEEFLREVDLASTLAADYFASRLEPGVLVHKVDFGRFAVLFCLDDREQSALVLGEVATLREKSRSELGFGLQCAVSDAIEGVDFISPAYYALLDGLEQAEATNGLPLIPAHREISSGSYYYPIDEETRILGNIAAGSAAVATENLRRLFAVNREEYKVSMPCVLYFIYAVKCTLIRARAEIELESEEDSNRFDYIIYLEKTTDPGQILDRCSEIIGILCAAVNNRKHQRSTRLVEAINAYIAANYHNDQLSLTMIAKHFMLVENYLGYLYKKQTGENLSAAIEAVRMKKAAGLLLDRESDTVKEIGALVGYSNSNTFYKAFKRHFGISPRGYAERARK